MKYRIVWFDDSKYHEGVIIAKNDKEAIEKSKTYDIGLGICFDLFKEDELIFSDDMWDNEAA